MDHRTAMLITSLVVLFAGAVVAGVTLRTWGRLDRMAKQGQLDVERNRVLTNLDIDGFRVMSGNATLGADQALLAMHAVRVDWFGPESRLGRLSVKWLARELG